MGKNCIAGAGRADPAAEREQVFYPAAYRAAGLGRQPDYDQRTKSGGGTKGARCGRLSAAGLYENFIAGYPAGQGVPLPALVGLYGRGLV